METKKRCHFTKMYELTLESHHNCIFTNNQKWSDLFEMLILVQQHLHSTEMAHYYYYY